MKAIVRKVFFTAILLAALGASSVFGQPEKPSPGGSASPILVDEFGRTNECDFGGRLDVFLAELFQKADHRGYIINYKGLDLLPGERQSFSRTSLIGNHFKFRGFDLSIVTIIDGGLRNELTTELWILPPGAEPPKPSKTVSEPRLPKKQSYLFDRGYLELGDFDDFDKKMLRPSVRAERDEHERRYQEELRKDQAESDESNTAEDPAETVFADELSEEEKDEFRFRWISEPFGRSLSNDKDTSGVLIFYADDHEYDIAALQRFVTEGIRRIEKSDNLKRGRIKVLFGGYRESMDVEFWIVPKKGIDPVPTPEEREVEEPEEVSTEN